MHPDGTPGQAIGLPHVGQILGGKYQIVRLLGEGGMAFVFEASHQRLQQRVAVKILAPEFARDVELVARFEREARAVARLRTKHVARVMDVDTTDEGLPYIVMEFLEGRDLDAELKERTRLSLGESVDIVLQACSGMLEAHGIGIVHRDLKPANLFLTTDRDAHDLFVKVLDFGISKVVGESTRLTGAGAVMGTVLYMSPEQVRALPNVDTRADIWALGVILYEILAGRAPWEGHSAQIAATIVTRDPPDIRTLVTLPEPLAVAIHTMLQRDPAARYPTVREVVAALAPYAPPGSTGAAVAEAFSLAQSGARSQPFKGALLNPKHTIPMSSRPAGLDAAVAAARASHVPHPATPTTPSALPPRSSVVPPSAGARSRTRLVLVFAVVIGLVGAAGVVLILMATLHKPRALPVAEDASTAPRASAESAAPSTTAEPMLAAPPSTGTAGRSTAPSESGSSRPTAPPAPSGRRPR